MPKAVKPRYARTPDETIALILGESAQLRLDQLEVQPPSNHEEDDVDDASQHSTDSDDSNRDHVGEGSQVVIRRKNRNRSVPASDGFLLTSISLRPNAPDTGEHWLKQGDAARHVEARTELSYICNRRILPLGNRVQPSTDGIDWTTGGRVKYSSWFEQNPNLQPSNSLGAMTFEYAAPNFINLSQIPPFDLSSRESAGSARVSRLYFGGRVAVCVAAVCSIESHVVAPNNPGPQSDVQCKWLSGVMHDQDWERFEAIVCLVVGEQFMYGQLTDNAVTFRTRLNPDPVLAESGNAMSSVSSSVKSSFSTSQTTPKRSTRSNTNLGKTLLNHNDPIPVYDARDTVVDFASDLDRLVEVLPLFHGEVPAAGLRAGIWVHSLVSASTYCGS
ncbi:hypothetical protein DFH06DRAFT_1386826 [Mycena polygramma]|nr:hypothetical protein DFH06DRAFT_1386826 [Mycena polygramma]